MNPSRYRADIDGLRAIAVISVLLYHLDFGAFSGGFIGVDVFFVISGFLITRLIRDEVLETHEFSFSNFYARRARRLFPSLFFTLSLSFVFAFLLFSQQHLQRFAGALVHTVLSTSNFYFWRESGYFDTDAVFKPLLHTWSLGVEEQFYAVWPLLLVIMVLKAPKLTPILLVLGGAFSLYLNHVFADGEIAVLSKFLPSVAGWFVDGPSTIFYLLPFRVFEFAIGASVVWLIRYQPRYNFALEPVVVVGLGMIAYSIFAYTEATLFPSVNALLPCFGAALIIYGGTAKYTGRLLSNRVAVGIGLISYSLYLIHWPIIVFYRYYTFEELALAEQIGIFAASILAAALMYRFVEQPFRRGARSPQALSRGAVGFACSILALFIMLPSANAWANGGWDWRVDTIEPSDYFSVEKTFRQTPQQIKESELSEQNRVESHGSNRNDRQRILVMGDSHAGHLARLGDYLGTKYDLEFEIYAFPGCKPIFGTYRVAAGTQQASEYDGECANQVLRWEQYVEENRFDYVAIAARWAVLFERGDYGGNDIPAQLLINRADPVFTVEASKRTFITQLEYTVRKIKDSGAKPIVFGQVVNHGKVLEGCDNVPKYLIGNDQIQARCSTIPKGLALERMSWTNGVIRDLGIHDGISVVIPTDYFCDTDYDYCRSFFDGTRLSDDDDHINEYGAIYLAKRWEADASFPLAAGATSVIGDGSATVNSNSATPTDPKLATGVVNGVTNVEWTTVSLPNEYSSMVVVATPNYALPSPPLVTRIQNASGDSFQVRVDRTDGLADTVAGVDVHYTVVEEGVYNVAEHGVKMEAVKFTSTVTDRKGSWTGQARGYGNTYVNPVVVGQVMTYNDADFSTFWSGGAKKWEPPSVGALLVGKHVGEDPVNDRADETVGYIVIEGGEGTVGSMSYVAGLGADTIEGAGDAPYTYAVGGSSNATSAVVSQAGMDGDDGGWAILYGPNPVTKEGLNLSIDEDQSGDAERAHTTEQVAFIVFRSNAPPN